MTLRRVTAVAGVFIPLLTMSALAQTAPADRHAVQQPTLQEQIDGVVGKITGNISDLRTAIIQYAGTAETLRQQLAEATQQIAAKDKTIADLTKERDALKTEKSTSAEPTKP